MSEIMFLLNLFKPLAPRPTFKLRSSSSLSKCPINLAVKPSTKLKGIHKSHHSHNSSLVKEIKLSKNIKDLQKRCNPVNRRLVRKDIQRFVPHIELHHCRSHSTSVVKRLNPHFFTRSTNTPQRFQGREEFFHSRYGDKYYDSKRLSTSNNNTIRRQSLRKRHSINNQSSGNRNMENGEGIEYNLGSNGSLLGIVNGYGINGRPASIIVKRCIGSTCFIKYRIYANTFKCKERH